MTTDILLIFFFLRAFKAAVLGAVTKAFGLAKLIFFFILSKPETIVPDVHPKTTQSTFSPGNMLSATEVMFSDIFFKFSAVTGL